MWRSASTPAWSYEADADFQDRKAVFLILDLVVIRRKIQIA